MKKRIDLYLITGFLGSGKTTLLKKLLVHLKNKKLAIIMNEFGQLGVDGAILDKKGFTISEINNGSIFCTCKSDTFIDAILHLGNRDIEILLVETSGISNPESMLSIMSVIGKKNKHIIYRGCITVVSAENISKLIQTSLFVRGQIKYANILILNKTDLASTDDITECENKIRDYNPTCKIYKTSYCEVSDVNEIMDTQLTQHRDFPEGQAYKSPVAKKFLLELEHRTSKEKFLSFLNSLKKDIYRVKGFAIFDDGLSYLIDGTTDTISIKPENTITESNFVVFIYPDDKPMHHIIKKTWAAYQEDNSN